MRAVGSDNRVLGSEVVKSSALIPKLSDLLPNASFHARVDSLLTRAEVTEPSYCFLLVQVGCRSFHSPVHFPYLRYNNFNIPDGHHLPVDPKGFIPGDACSGGRALVELVELEGVIVKGCLRRNPSFLLSRTKDSSKEGRLTLALSPQSAGQEPKCHVDDNL